MEAIPKSQAETPERLHMQVEQVTEQGVGKMNEDAILVGKRRFGVFDGASSLDGYTDKEGKTGAYLASHLAEKAFEDESLELLDAAARGNERIQAAMRANGIDIARKESTWCTALAVVDVDLEKKEFQWTQIADALLLVVYKDGSYKMLIQDDYDHDKDVLTKWKKLADAGVTNIRPQLQDEIVALRRTQNVNYGALNGDPVALTFLRTGRESLDDVACILIFTDGLMIPKEDPNAEDDFATTAKVFIEQGLVGLKNYVRSIEESDPQCLRYPRYKKHDDIAAIAVNITNK